jgi:hypothetical protein
MSEYSESFLSDYRGDDDQNEGQNSQENTEVFRGIRQTLEETSRNLSHEQQQHVQTKQELQEEREKRQQLELKVIFVSCFHFICKNPYVKSCQDCLGIFQKIIF